MVVYTQTPYRTLYIFSGSVCAHIILYALLYCICVSRCVTRMSIFYTAPAYLLIFVPQILYDATVCNRTIQFASSLSYAVYLCSSIRSQPCICRHWPTMSLRKLATVFCAHQPLDKKKVSHFSLIDMCVCEQT